MISIRSLLYKAGVSRSKLKFLFTSFFHFFLPRPKWRFSFSICSIIKNEGPYLDEWIKYHLCAGVQHFYLYDNDSNDNTREVLDAYIKQGIVTYSFFPGRGKQLYAYSDCCKRYGKESYLVAFIDADEFIVFDLNGSGKDAFSIIRPFIHGRVSGLGLNWLRFGNSGQSKKEDGGVIERFQMREGKYSNTIKTIAMPSRIYCWESPHFPVFYKGFYSTDCYGNRTFRHSVTTLAESYPIWLNHYVTKSTEEWVARKKLGWADSATPPNGDLPWDIFTRVNKNEVMDKRALTFFKTAMAENGFSSKASLRDYGEGCD